MQQTIHVGVPQFWETSIFCLTHSYVMCNPRVPQQADPRTMPITGEGQVRVEAEGKELVAPEAAQHSALTQRCLNAESGIQRASSQEAVDL